MTDPAVVPADQKRDIALLKRKVADLERKLAARAATDLNGLLDTEVIYNSPIGGAPYPGAVLTWYPNPAVVPFGGLWKPGWPTPHTYQYSTGYVANGTVVDLRDYGPELPTGLYACSMSCQAAIPADCCGWYGTANAIGAPGYAAGMNISSSDRHGVGSSKGIWTGSTGDSGSYGWQAPEAPMSIMVASGISIVPFVAGFEQQAVGSFSAWVLDDPGTGPTHYGSDATTQVDSGFDVTYAVSVIRIAPLNL